MRRFDRAAAATVASFALVVLPAGGEWGAGDRNPLQEAADATDDVAFSALVSVRWRDRGRIYEMPVEVEASRHRLHVGGPMEVALGPTGRPSLRTERWLRVLVKEPDGAVVPDLEEKYDIRREPGPTIGGRATHLWVLTVDGRLRERLAVDEATGLVLHRELFGSSGRLAREVTVKRLDTAVSRSAGPSSADVEDQLRPVSPRRLPALYRAPDVLAGGYRQVGAYQGEGHVQHVYSDGLHGMSLFVRPGDLSELGDEGRAVRVDGSTGRRYGWPGGEVVAWEAGSMVHLLVSDAPGDEVLAAARSVPEPDGLSWPGRLRRACRRLAEMVSGGP